MKRVLFAALVLISMLITSCDGQTNDPKGGYRPFIGGSEGLAMHLVTGAPPPEIYDDGGLPFSIHVLVENVGEHNVRKSEVMARLLGMEPSLFRVNKEDLFVRELEVGLRGATKLPDGRSIPGDPTTLFFPSKSEGGFAYLPNLMGTSEMMFRAELCYDYMTYSTTHVCIKDQIMDNLMNDKICSVSEDKLPQNSGGPIHISNMRQMPQGQHNSVVIFTVEHIGSGIFFKPDAQADLDGWACADRLYNQDQDVVHLDVYFEAAGSATPLRVTCGLLQNQNSGFLPIHDRVSREVSCTIHGNKDGTRIYEDILRIDISYKYLNFIEKTLIIRDMSKQNFEWDPDS